MENYTKKLVLDDKSKLNNNNFKNYKTSNLFIFLYSFFIVILPYLIIWLLFGDLNILQKNWLLPTNLTNDVFVVHDNIFYIMIGITFFTIFVYLIFHIFKLVFSDLIPFIVMFNIVGWLTIISGGIPYNESSMYYIIIARFLIVIVGAILFFYIVNKIVFKLSLRYENINYKFIEYKNEQKVLDEIMAKRKKRKSDNPTYIEIEQDKELI